MVYQLKDIAAALGAEALGAADLCVQRLSEPGTAGPDDLALAMSPRFASALEAGQARAAVVWAGADWRALGLEAAIEVPRSRLAMAQLTRAVKTRQPTPGIHPSAIVDPTAEIGKSASIGALSVIDAGARIGANARIGAHVSIGMGVVIGDDAQIRDGVRLMSDTRIGHRFIAQPNVVIGGDGFSFVTEEASGAEQVKKTLGTEPVIPPSDPTWHRIHSLGGVEIGDDVEIGAQSAVDAGTIRPTSIGSGTKIDNLVQIGHNVRLGQHVLICAHCAIGGSCEIGDRTILGGRSAVADNLTVGSDVVIGGASVVLTRVRDGQAVLGHPALPMDKDLALYKALRRLPRALMDIAALKRSVSNDDPSD